MGRNALLIGEVAKQTGTMRKALRLYEAAGILPAPRRTPAGSSLRRRDARSSRLCAAGAAFTLDEIKEIIAIKRAGRLPCAHVRDLVERKTKELDQRLADLMAVRKDLRGLLGNWRRRNGAKAAEPV